MVGAAVALRIPTREQIHVATQAIPHAPYDRLLEHGGPSVILEVNAGGFRIRHTDMAKAAKRREDAFRREAIELGLTPQSRGWLNDDMEFWGLDEPAPEERPSILGKGANKGARTTSWSRASRALMRWRLAGYDYTPLFQGDGDVGVLTLSLPGQLWEVFAPEPRAWVKILELFQQRFEDAFGYRPEAVHKTEFQRRGAVHEHILMRIPEGLSGGRPHTSLENGGQLTWIRQTGGTPEFLFGNPSRQQRAGYDLASLNTGGLDFKNWAALTFAKIVGRERVKVDGKRIERFRLSAPTPVSSPDRWVLDVFCDHVCAGIGVDYPEQQYRDPKRIAEYFSKHGAFAGKEYQNKMPALWLKAIEYGASSFHFWGSWRLEDARSSVELSQAPRYLRGSKASYDQLSEPPSYVKKRIPDPPLRGQRRSAPPAFDHAPPPLPRCRPRRIRERCRRAAAAARRRRLPASAHACAPLRDAEHHGCRPRSASAGVLQRQCSSGRLRQSPPRRRPTWPRRRRAARDPARRRPCDRPPTG